MGFFSWKTSDTKRSIANQHSKRPVFTVHLITEDRQIFTEENYDGYGVFGGVDFYDLVSDLNNLKGENEKRELAINLLFKTIPGSANVSRPIDCTKTLLT